MVKCVRVVRTLDEAEHYYMCHIPCCAECAMGTAVRLIDLDGGRQLPPDNYETQLEFWFITRTGYYHVYIPGDGITLDQEPDAKIAELLIQLSNQHRVGGSVEEIDELVAKHLADIDAHYTSHVGGSCAGPLRSAE